MPGTISSTAAAAPFSARATLRPLALLLMAAGLVFTTADPDLWGHLRFGLDILDTGRVVTDTDRYSFTADRPFLYHEWLGGTIMALVYRSAGPVGLQIFKAALGASLFALLWAGLRKATFTWRWGALAVAALCVLPILATIRPQIWSLLGVVIVTRIVMSPSPWAPVALPPLFALWANLHGGWIVGGGILAIFATCALFEPGRRHRWTLFATGVLSFAATLVTPYGITLWLFLAETVRLGRGDISEWLPIWVNGWDSILLWVVPVAVCVATFWRRRVPVATGIVLVALGFAAAMVDRMSPLFAVAVVTLLRPEWRGDGTSPASDVGRTLLESVAIVVVLVALAVVRAPATCIAITGYSGQDTVAAESLRGRTGRLAVFFDWGEYALWHFGPGLQVSLDARRETLYREATLKAQQAVAHGTPLGLETLERMRADYVWLPIQSPARAWLESHGYRVDIATDHSFIATRADHPALTPWLGQSSRCFPGP